MGEPRPDPDREDLLDEIVARYLSEAEGGRPPDPEELTRRHPDLAEEIRAFLADYGRLQEIASPLDPLPSAPGLAAGSRLGDYEILDELARGGMGVVYRARQRSLHRDVALKVILGGSLASRRDLDRFRLEAEAAAALDHPNIVSIHEIGEHEGVPFFSMRFVDGPELGARLPDLARDPTSAARLVETSARAVHYAHERGVLHRDIKPANILVDEQGEPHLTDFGLAKLVEADSELTVTGAVLGTPGYIAPEQIESGRAEATTACDVYGLGAVLFACLTGRAPFAGGSRLETLELVRRDPPPSPRSLNPRVPRDLETICLRCLEKEPSRRYASAGELADDIHRHLDGEPIAARPLSILERAVRWTRRHPARAALFGVSVLAVGSILALSLLYQRELERALDVARQEGAAARRARYSAEVGLAWGAWRSGRLERMRKLLDIQRPRAGEEDLRCVAWRYLRHLAGAKRLSLLDAGRDPGGFCVATHPRRPLVATGHVHAVRLWDRESGGLVATLSGHAQCVVAVAFSPHGGYLASATAAGIDHIPPDAPPGVLTLWDLEARRPVRRYIGPEKGVYCVAFDPREELIAAGGGDGAVRLWSVESETPVATRRLSGPVRTVVFTPDGEGLLTTSDDPEGAPVTMWSRRLERARWTGRHPARRARAAAVSPDGKIVATGDETGGVRLMDATSGAAMRGMRVSGRARSIAFSPDSARLVAAGLAWDGSASLRVWGLHGTILMVRECGLTGPVHGLAFSSDGDDLATVGPGCAWLWNARILTERTFVESGFPPCCLTFSPDGRTLAIGGREGQVSLRDPGSGTERRSVESAGGRVRSIAFSPSGDLLASASSDGVVLVDLTSPDAADRLPESPGVPNVVAFDPTGDRLIVGSFRTIRVFDVRRRRIVRDVDAHADRVYSVVFSPDGKHLVSGGLDDRIRVWSPGVDRLEHEFRAGGDGVRSLALSPDGRVVAVGCENRTARLFDLGTGEPLRVLEGHGDVVHTVVFARDGRALATGSPDLALRVWDPITGQERVGVKAALNPQGLTCVAVSPDGALLASGDSIGVVRLWWAPPLSELDAEQVASERARPEAASPGGTPDPCTGGGWTDITPPGLRDAPFGIAVSAADVDDDGDVDLFLAFDGTDRLLLAEGPGRYRESSPGSFGGLSHTSSALWTDADGDGDLDLYAARKSGASRLYLADRAGALREATPPALAVASDVEEAHACDVDGDGRLDLFLVTGRGSSRLVRGGGAGRFEDATPLALRREARAACWCDVDGDRDPDLYLASDSGGVLLENRYPDAFLDRTPPAHLSSLLAGHGTWADGDGDGRVDLFLTRFRGQVLLLRGEEDLRLRASSVEFPSDLGAGSPPSWVDHDLDGNLDLFLASNEGRSRLLRCDGSEGYADVTCGPLRALGSVGRVVWCDLDDDGDLDLVAPDFDRRIWILRNDTTTPGDHWLQVRLRGLPGNTRGIGARVLVTAGRRTLTRRAGGSPADVPGRLTFGLGSDAESARVEVVWRSGRRQEVGPVAVDRVLTIVEGTPSDEEN